MQHLKVLIVLIKLMNTMFFLNEMLVMLV